MTGNDQPALDFYPFGPPQPPSPTCANRPESAALPNESRMGIATVGPRGEFVSSRLFTPTELLGAWMLHFQIHGSIGGVT